MRTVVVTIVRTLTENLPLLIDAALQLIEGLAEGLLEALPVLIEAMPDLIIGIVNALIDNIDKIIEAGVRLFAALVENLPAIVAALVKAIPQIVNGIVNAFNSNKGKFVDLGGNIVRGPWQGIQSLDSWLWDNVSGWISGIWDGICLFFGIASPSKEMAWIGEMMTKGLAGGIEESGNLAVEAVTDMGRDIDGAVKEIADGLGESLPESVDIGADAHLGAYMTEPPAAGSGRTGGSDQIMTLVSLLGEYLPYLPQLANMKVALDTGTLVGELAPQMDERLGVLALRQRRQ